mmetsp:Transcript_24356/g.29524  ORF Transcript_24356/g.29524 Transcript_24356/m.29524 type:complete len:341 (+) Transcript_24356:246-1268(+)|eukprot:CAMPEP_0197847466 /NCGR_PEP_ID=MMETSP1438-20131217/6316_1 /TAXON_ID=1461541 /ORGANISM="Pterosperma sp., Strain CCMP1384" /LENGTH=340 /DNA_ID=CAMNT_0043459399 /DNA_START=244 /DNA_END=1266 /DNA_ORIENTATION=+
MASYNMFALLGGEDDDMPQAPVAAKADKSKEADKPKAVAKPAIKSDGKGAGSARSGGKGQGQGRDGGKGGRGGYDRAPRDDEDDNSGYGSRNAGKGGRRDGGKGGYRRDGGKGGYRGDGEEGRPRKREFDRRSGTGKGAEVKRDGAGKANWGSEKDEINAAAEGATADAEAEPEELDPEAEAAAAEAAAEKEREEKEMTLEEYQKVLAEKRSALQQSFNKENSERQVNDSAFAKMTLVAKSEEEEVYFVGEAKTKKTKSKKAADADEDAEKVVPNFSFARKEEYTPRDSGKGKGGKGGRPRRENGGGKGGRGASGYGGKGGRGYSAPNIGDSSAFPTLGA